MKEQSELKTTFSTSQLEKEVNSLLEKGLTYLEAIMQISLEKEKDPEWIVPYIKGSLKEKLRVEAENNRLLKKDSKAKILFE